MFEWCKQVQVGVKTQICEKCCAPTKNVSASSVPRSRSHHAMRCSHLSVSIARSRSKMAVK